ncbi:MmcQ/YjbR family DNA-binding protein [Falsiroseomonas selenitidurans]|uniref:MmcQ/YjbR family DNA-binding protein n=1 Tax=Falsiroseomonas selenitidurans TaxID=2716335 RepID=A0ABX1DXB0_9PROT|nr:MmcQ/YjbR family DNA-binding protein [Falsiroseomonas selenitidurans]NKC29516.1 MmcQ/YjbR family DNA-binding protein [Falsiroseomonas selenitidurans]
MAASPTARLRRICLALPEAAEVETWEQPTFRVRGRIFAMLHAAPDGLAVWFKAPPGSQELLLEAAPDRFFRPPYLGHKGWVALRLGGSVDWAEAAAQIRRSYSLIAPKRLAARIEGDDAG